MLTSTYTLTIGLLVAKCWRMGFEMSYREGPSGACSLRLRPIY